MAAEEGEQEACGCMAGLVLPTLADSASLAGSAGDVVFRYTTTARIGGILRLPLMMIAMRGKDAGTADLLSSMARASGYFTVVPFPGYLGWPCVDAGSWPPSAVSWLYKPSGSW